MRIVTGAAVAIWVATAPAAGRADVTEPEAAPPETTTPRPAPPSEFSPSPPHEVVVVGRSAAQRLRESARAVQVVETKEAQKQNSDLGEVLARSPGVGVRREGGLGSGTRLSLGGLGDDQVRVFLDGVPLELAGYSYGVANVPVNLVERVEVYRGVVPIRFGADALGGAVNLVSDEDVRGTRAGASYQAGSFGTQRLAFSLRSHDEHSGFFTRLSGFHDVADNDYPIDAKWPNELGRLEPLRAYRFHDAYRATGANLEAGLFDRSWARRLVFRAFLTDREKELQHGTVVTIPYGDIESRRTRAGVSARYVGTLARVLALDALVGYSSASTRFLDPDRCFYDWQGRCARESENPDPSDYLTRDRTGFARLSLEWRAQPEQRLRLALAPTFATVEGDERAGADANDGDQRELLTWISGIEHELSLFGDRLQNIVFAKAYLQAVRADKHVGELELNRDRDTLYPGFGDSLRYRFTTWLYAKASYEWATRLPNLDEIFGNGILTLPNLDLLPERSHNGNLGLVVDGTTGSGFWYAELNAFVRDSHDQILLLQSQDLALHQNVFSARALGAEAGVRWTSPGKHVTLDGNVTHLDFRNTAHEGSFAHFKGDRMPNRPYLLANGSVRLAVSGVADASDELSLTWYSRYVHEFFRSWESVGQRDLKEVIPAQLVHSSVLVYEVRGDALQLSNSVEVQNVTDERAYDYFGVQRPGRAFFFKMTAQR